MSVPMIDGLSPLEHLAAKGTDKELLLYALDLAERHFASKAKFGEKNGWASEHLEVLEERYRNLYLKEKVS